MKTRLLMCTSAAIVFVLAGHAAAAGDAAFREDFATLDGWEPLKFPKIEKHTRDSIQTVDGQTVLKAEADASASGLVHRETVPW